jgi:glutathione S-transferase
MSNVSARTETGPNSRFPLPHHALFAPGRRTILVGAALTTAGAREAPETVAACYDLIEQDMLEGPWVMGDTYTICDPYLFTFAQWLEDDGVDPSRIPKVIEHRKRMSERPSVGKAIAEELRA